MPRFHVEINPMHNLLPMILRGKLSIIFPKMNEVHRPLNSERGAMISMTVNPMSGDA
jgi:hypothetical protein